MIGILANLFTQGDFDDAHALLLDARSVVGSPEYVDGLWTYSWPWAVYLLKTGDLAFVKANFSTPGPAGATEPSIEESAHRIAADRTGPNGIIGMTNDIDSNGYWTVDDYEALMGLAAYRYLAQRVGDAGEASGRTGEYDSLLAATNATLTATIHRYHLDYLPCSMLEPNTREPMPESRGRQLGGAVPFRALGMGRAALRGAGEAGPESSSSTRRTRTGSGASSGKLPRDTFGGYPVGLLLDRLQRGLRQRRSREHAVPRPGNPRLRVHDRAHAERAVLVVGERVGAVDRLAVDRKPSDRRRRIVAARVGHRRTRTRCCSTRSSRRLRTARSIVGRGVPDDWLKPGLHDLGRELPDHEREADQRRDHRRRSLRDPRLARFDRHGAVRAPAVRRQHRVVERGIRRPGDRNGAALRERARDHRAAAPSLHLGSVSARPSPRRRSCRVRPTSIMPLNSGPLDSYRLRTIGGNVFAVLALFVAIIAAVIIASCANWGTRRTARR